MNRRQWLLGAGLIAASGTRVSGPTFAAAQEKAKPTALELSQYEPKSMLQVHESRVERAKYPVIDFHTILSGCQVGTGTVLGMTALKKMNDYWRSWKDLAAKAEAEVRYCRLWQQAEASEWQSLRQESQSVH